MPELPEVETVVRGIRPDLVGHTITDAWLDWSPGLEGIQKDMPLNQALAVDDKVELVQADLPLYWSTFSGILDRLESVISPLVEGAELGTVYLDIDGLQLIYPDTESLVGAVREQPEMGYRIGTAGRGDEW